MKKAMTSVPFHGTAEQLAALDAVIAEHKTQAGALMPVLQKAQDIYGYLPIEVQKEIARGLDVSLEEVYGVSTFYSQFSLTPKGKYNISICLAASAPAALHRSSPSTKTFTAVSFPRTWIRFLQNTQRKPCASFR